MSLYSSVFSGSVAAVHCTDPSLLRLNGPGVYAAATPPVFNDSRTRCVSYPTPVWVLSTRDVVLSAFYPFVALSCRRLT